MESGFTLEKDQLLKQISGAEDFGPYSKFRSVEANLMLEATENELRLPTFTPTCGDKVFVTTENDHEMLGVEGDLQIGWLRSGSHSNPVPVGVQLSAIPKHIGLFGVTGSGKTNTELLINAQILEQPNTVGLIFDFHGELWEGKGIGKGLKDHPHFPFRGRYYPEDKIKIGVGTLSAQDIIEIFPDMTDSQRRACRELEREIGDFWVQKVRNGNVPSELKAHKLTVEAVLRRISDLNREIFVDVATSLGQKVVGDLKEGFTVLIDLSGFLWEDQKRIASIITRAVANEYKRVFREDIQKWSQLPTLLITLEEAHEFLGEEKTFFSDVALTFRKYRVGLCVVTPRPSRINKDVFAELWTKIIMKTTYKGDREFLTTNTPYLEYSDVEIKVLDRGEALLVSEPQFRFAVPIKTIHYPEYLEGREKINYGLEPSTTLSKMDEQLRRITQAGQHLTLFT
jgi:hypothetical protein